MAFKNIHSSFSNKQISISLALVLVLLFGCFALWHQKSPAVLSMPEVEQLRIDATNAHKKNAEQTLLTAAKHDQVLAQNAIGQIYLAQGKIKQALIWLERAARQGHSSAGVTLGKLYLRGDQGITKKYDQALYWFKPAAEAGDASAAYYMGIIYQHGYGQPINTTEAVKWFQVAAQQQQANAMFMLANAYRDGDGILQNKAEAIRLYQAAADLELPEAIQELAMAYRHGTLGLSVDQAAYQRQTLEIAHSLKHPAMTP
jgi:TPR repeat protein